MQNIKMLIGLFVIGVLSLAGCTEFENINDPLNDSDSSSPLLIKNSDIPERDAPPMKGIVVEGTSVPEIELGFTRAQVEIAYGEPQWCQSNGNPGNKAYCSFPVNGGGQVNVHYRGADGGQANGTYDDVVFKVDWTEAVNGWITTAGINTTLAKESPEKVIKAYPDARVYYNQYGSIYRVIDYQLGIEVLWIPDFYTGLTHVQMAIFYSMKIPPLAEKSTQITSINLTSKKVRGKRQVQVSVKIQDKQNQSVYGANVIARWTFPDGSIQVVEDATSGSGNAHFELIDISRGTYSLTIQDVVLEDYLFDYDNSVLSESINVK